MSLREAYLSRYRVQRKSADLTLAVEKFRLASRHPTQGLPNASLRHQHGHASALEAYSTFFELLDAHLATRSSTTQRREAAAVFRRAKSLPVDAGSCGIRRNDLRKAVELLEQGRGQQWTPLENLQSTNSHIAHRFLELSRDLADAQAAADRAATQYRKLQEQWGVVVAEIRDIKGFSRFLLPPSYEDLQAAARHGPVIIFVASQYSCSAIIVRRQESPIMFLANLKDPANDLIVLLRTVWDEIMLPIVNVLEHLMKKRVPPSWAIGQGQPRAGESKELLAVDSEIELVRKLVPATARPATVNRTTISGDAATRAGALQALENNNWVHLASYILTFVMKDEPITLLDIGERHPSSRVRVLISVSYRRGDEKTPDEAIHLAAGLQFSGFKS
ncbi:hypothetical protein BDR07DRAFT_1409531, partial [Suillus spraguei]